MPGFERNQNENVYTIAVYENGVFKTKNNTRIDVIKYNKDGLTNGTYAVAIQVTGVENKLVYAVKISESGNAIAFEVPTDTQRFTNAKIVKDLNKVYDLIGEKKLAKNFSLNPYRGKNTIYYIGDTDKAIIAYHEMGEYSPLMLTANKNLKNSYEIFPDFSTYFLKDNIPSIQVEGDVYYLDKAAQTMHKQIMAMVEQEYDKDLFEVIYLMGASGSGKSLYPKILAEYMGWRFEMVSMNIASDNQTDFFLDTTLKDLTLNYKLKPFLQALESDEDCVILLDEVNRANPIITNLLLQILNNETQDVYISSYGNFRVNRDKKIIVFLTANEGSEYNIANMDAAILNRRTATYNFSDYDRTVAEAISSQIAGDQYAEQIVDLVEKIRDYLVKYEYNSSDVYNISLRTITILAKKTLTFGSVYEAIYPVYLNAFQRTNTELYTGLSNIVSTIELSRKNAK